MVVVAHAGHWILYLVPVLIVLGAVVVSSIIERRARREAERRPSPSREEDAL